MIPLPELLLNKYLICIMSIGYKILVQLKPVNFSPQEKQQFEIAGVEHDLISLFLSVCAIKKAIFPKGSKISRGWTEVRQSSPSVGRGAVGIFLGSHIVTPFP